MNKSTKNTCPYCGDSPVNHILAYIAQTVGIFLSPLFRKFSKFSHSRFSNWLLNSANLFYVSLSQKLHIIWFGKNKAGAVTGRSQVIWDEAIARGIEMQQMIVYGKPVEQYRAKIKNNKWFYFESLPIPQNLAQSSYDYIDDKIELKKVLTKAGISVPKSISVSNQAEALAAFNLLSKPVITKPRVGSRGRHTTVYINNEEELVKSFNIAQKICLYVAVEEYLTGPVCRATLVGKKLVGFFEAKPPEIVGDGKHSVTELIEIKNKTKPERVEDIKINKESLDYLARQGQSVDSIPDSGVVVQILSRTGRYFGGETRELVNTVHPKLREYLETAVNAIDVPVVGFDVIIPDPEADPDTQKWGIIEANSLPFIDLHYYPLHGKPVNIASYVWDLWK